MIETPYLNDEGEVVRICGDCYIERLLEDFIRDGEEHPVCNFCSPPAMMPASAYDRRLIEGHRMLGTEDE